MNEKIKTKNRNTDEMWSKKLEENKQKEKEKMRIVKKVKKLHIIKDQLPKPCPLSPLYVFDVFSSDASWYGRKYFCPVCPKGSNSELEKKRIRCTSGILFCSSWGAYFYWQCPRCGYEYGYCTFDSFPSPDRD